MGEASKPFDRAALERAFGRLGELARSSGKVVDISVYGGSALVLTTDFRVATRDVDAVFEADKQFVRRASYTIAEEFGWDENWINDGVKGFLSGKDSQPDAKSLLRSYPSEDNPGVRVFVASPSYLFAMKCLAMRAGAIGEAQDFDDIRKLGLGLNIRSAEEAIEAVSRYYPAARLPPKTRFGLEEIFDDPVQEEPRTR